MNQGQIWCASIWLHWKPVFQSTVTTKSIDSQQSSSAPRTLQTCHLAHLINRTQNWWRAFTIDRCTHMSLCSKNAAVHFSKTVRLFSQKAIILFHDGGDVEKTNEEMIFTRLHPVWDIVRVNHYFTFISSHSLSCPSRVHHHQHHHHAVTEPFYPALGWIKRPQEPDRHTHEDKK